MASPTTPRYCKYFFSARGCNQGNDCKYLHQQMDEVRMELPCTALSIDIETTGCWPGVHKIVAIGVALFQLHPSHQVVELDRRLFQFKVNYPQDFDEITMRDFWHVQGRMELLEVLQNGAVEEEEAIKDFYDYYTEVCYRYPKFFLITDNPVMDLGFLNLSIATKLKKPPLTYRPVLRSPRADESALLRLTCCLGASLELSASSSTPTSSATRSLSGLSETESDDELSTDGSEESDEDAFGESGEEDGADCDTNGNASTAGATGDRLLAQAAELAKRVQLQTPVDSNKKLASFYDDYSAPHFAIDLNSFACGLVGLHLPPFRRAGGSRWASPADFLSYHKPFLVCPYRKTHDPVDDASFNCWQFLQCISIVWMNEYAEIHQSRVKEESVATKPNGSTSINSGSLSPHQPNKCGNGAAATAGGARSTSPKPAYNDAEFPTIASANATSNDRKKQQQQQQQRSPRRGRAVSTLAVTPDKAAASPSRCSGKQQTQRQPRLSPTSAASPSNPQHKITTKTPCTTGPGPSSSPSSQVQRRTARSHSDPPALTELTTCSNTAAAIAKASAFSPERGSRQQRSAVLF